MSLQLIFVVETNKTCKSDWIYIKDTIDYFFEYDRTAIKLTPVYMDGKGKYKHAVVLCSEPGSQATPTLYRSVLPSVRN